MTDFFLLMGKPLLACLILTGIHVYFGMHVVERKVIFVDLALAQIAALGATLALLFGASLHGESAYGFSLTAAFIGAAIFSVTRTHKETIPQEAIIGMVYAVAASLAILILSRTAEGDEHIRHMLVGNILLVDTDEILKMALLYGLIGIFHFVFRKKFWLISSNPEEAYRQKISVKKWDFLFYATFGLVVTSSVGIAGVLLVFTFLIGPVVAAMLFTDRFLPRLLLSWGIGLLASLAGVSLSYTLDLPTGAAVVASTGGILVVLGLLRDGSSRTNHP